MSACVVAARSLPYSLQVCLVAAVYLAAAKAALLFAIPPGYATAIWPASGIAVASCLLLGERIWPAIWLGATLANLPVAYSLFAAPAIACGNTLEAVACAALVRALSGVGPHFGRSEDVIKFVASAALSCVIAATVAVHVLIADGAMAWSEFAVNWWTWWQGDLTGIIIVTPLLLSWTLQAGFASRAQAAEFFALMVSSSLVVAAIFGDWFVEDRPLPLSFLVLPFVVWSAFRFGQREVTTVGATVSVIAIWYTLAGRGEFARPAMNESLLCLLAFIGTVAVTGLVLSAALGRRAK
jgi:integral membrane sensor domain MASE1